MKMTISSNNINLLQYVDDVQSYCNICSRLNQSALSGVNAFLNVTVKSFTCNNCNMLKIRKLALFIFNVTVDSINKVLWNEIVVKYRYMYIHIISIIATSNNYIFIFKIYIGKFYCNSQKKRCKCYIQQYVTPVATDHFYLQQLATLSQQTLTFL